MAEIRPVSDRAELEEVLNLLVDQFPGLDMSDSGFGDLVTRFPADQPLMLMAITGGQFRGRWFRNDNGWVTLRIMALVEAFRHHGIGRQLVERIETQARLLSVEGIALGTDEAVGFWHHLGYTRTLLLQWVYHAELYEAESESLLAGPLAGLPHRRSSFSDVPQLFVELDQPRLDLRHKLREIVTGCQVGLMMAKKIALPSSLMPQTMGTSRGDE